VKVKLTLTQQQRSTAPSGVGDHKPQVSFTSAAKITKEEYFAAGQEIKMSGAEGLAM
jgi:hypothetical protein